MQEEEPTTDQHYWAQIAAEVKKGLVQDPGVVRREDFLLRRVPVEEALPQPSTPSPAQRMSRSRAFWCGALGIKPPKKKKKE